MSVPQLNPSFEGLEVGFCCLGTTRGKSGAAGFVKIEHDYVVSTAKVAKAAGCKHFNLITAQSPNKNSWFLYPKTKALAEEHSFEVGFDRFSVFRPGFLICARQNLGIPERAAGIILKPVIALKPTLMSVPTTSVGKAMVMNLFRTAPADGAMEVVENAELHTLGAEFDKCFGTDGPEK